MTRWALVIVLTIGLLVIASENRLDPVAVQLLFGFRAPALSLGALMVLSFAAGAAVVALAVAPAWIRAVILTRRQRRMIESLEGQVAAGNDPSRGAPPPHDFA